MPLYMTQFSYTAEAWSALAKSPQDRGQAFGHQVVPASNPIPLLALVFESIDVQSDRCSAGANDRSKGRIRRIADQGSIVTLWDCMQR